jgi:hypothetical protein
MHRFHVAFLGLLLGAIPAASREGYVRTRGGAVYEGHIRLESDAVVVVSAARELWIKIAATNVLGITFPDEPDAGLTDSERAPAGDSGSWTSEDVGSVRWSGGMQRTAGVIRVRGSGTNILATSDAFHFVFRRVQGPSQIVARVTRVSLTDPWARAGLMMREGLAADARNVLLSVTAARGGVFQWREQAGEETDVTLNRALSVPCWLKLKRDGGVFSAFTSANGRQWTEVARRVLPAAEQLCVGLAVVGVREQMLNESVFEAVEEGPRLPNRWFSPQVELRSASVQRGAISALDDNGVRFAGRPPRPPLARSAVANIRFQPLPQRAGALLNSGRLGALLSNGDFIDGECRAIADGLVVVSSVPLGLCRYDVGAEVVALVLARRGSAADAACEVTTVDRSTWVGSEVRVDEAGLSIREPLLGLRRIPLHEVLEFRRRW